MGAAVFGGRIGGTGTTGGGGTVIAPRGGGGMVIAQENEGVFAITAASVHRHKVPESPKLGEASGVALLPELCRRRRPLAVGALSSSLRLRYGCQISIRLFHEHLPQGRRKRFVYKEEVSIEEWVNGTDLAVIEGIVGADWGGSIRIDAHKGEIFITFIFFILFTVVKI